LTFNANQNNAEVQMQVNDQGSVFEGIGKLDAETKNLQEEFENGDDQEEAVVGLLGIIGKVLKQIFDI
jgi:hypothetical protein